MAKGFHKKASKRVPAKRRYKIEKKVREHNKKLRKHIKKKNLKNKHKDPGIPNSLPFKEKIINEIQEHKIRAEEIKEMQKIQMKRNRLNQQSSQEKNTEIAELLKNAEKRTQDFENRTTIDDFVIKDDESSILSSSCANIKSFFRDVQKVIESSDIILEVIDARDPLGTRCFEIEDLIGKNHADKKIILLLNKCDLIPRDNLLKWLKYLRNSFLTVPFKACTQNQRQNLTSTNVNLLLSSNDLLKTSKCVGGDFLMKILNNYCHNKGVKTSITIGVVGFPNVGKSSVINSLKRSYVCNVGPKPGLTRSMQLVSLDKKIKLIDSPGIVFAKNISNNGDDSNTIESILALRNAVNVDKIPDPILPVQAILNRVNGEDLTQIYGLMTQFNTVQEFLSLVAKRFGKVVKGGRLDLESAAKKVLHDWNHGKLKYYTLPPEPAETDSEMVGEMKFVDKICKEFDLTEVRCEELMAMDLEQLDNENMTDAFALKPSTSGNHIQTKLDQVSVLENKNSNPQNDSNGDVEMMEIMEGMQLNKNVKTRFKKMKKQKKRDAKLSNQMEQINLQEDYDFDDF